MYEVLRPCSINKHIYTFNKLVPFYRISVLRGNFSLFHGLDVFPLPLTNLAENDTAANVQLASFGVEKSIVEVFLSDRCISTRVIVFHFIIFFKYSKPTVL